ncbi:hypothetical protein ABZV34_35895 [Streptomyces sp. NPDC005195]|uniref:hypothetical protein n=1 Tax=Streptomyces sp. NPDC005195 TaxID=3154561 RepID=UPI0033B19F32
MRDDVCRFILGQLSIEDAVLCGPARTPACGLAKDAAFATKPELPARMIGRFLDAGIA